MQETEQKRWYVVWAASRCERRLSERLSRELSGEGERVWLPTRIERRRMGEGAGDRDFELLLFPGYVFVYTAQPEELHTILKKKNISDFLKILQTGDEFVPITDEEEEILKRLTGETGRVDISTGLIREGVLQVIQGPLKGMEPYVRHIDRHKKKATLEMTLFGEKKRFTAGLEIIEKTV